MDQLTLVSIDILSPKDSISIGRHFMALIGIDLEKRQMTFIDPMDPKTPLHALYSSEDFPLIHQGTLRLNPARAILGFNEGLIYVDAIVTINLKKE